MGGGGWMEGSMKCSDGGWRWKEGTESCSDGVWGWREGSDKCSLRISKRNCSISPLARPACLISKRFSRNGDYLKLSPRLEPTKATTSKPPYWTLQTRTFVASVNYSWWRWRHGCGPVAGHSPPKLPHLRRADVRPRSCTTR